jgi:hypothetical protein
LNLFIQFLDEIQTAIETKILYLIKQLNMSLGSKNAKQSHLLKVIPRVNMKKLVLNKFGSIYFKE